MANLITPLLDRLQNGEPTPNFRRFLQRNLTAALRAIPDEHNCNQVNPEHAAYKIEARIATTYFRFLISSVAKCTTFRGRTYLQAHRAPCRNRCQSAHVSLSPNLKHNAIGRLYRTVRQPGGENTLSPFAKRLYQKIKRFSAPNTTIRKVFKNAIPHFRRRLQEDVRNMTVDNPTACNRVDCFIEKTMRKAEDIYAERCANSQVTPKIAASSFFREYLARLDVATANLNQREAHWNRFLELEGILMEGVIDRSDGGIAQFKAYAQEFLDLRKALMKSLEGTPSFVKTIRDAPISALQSDLSTFMKTQLPNLIQDKLNDFEEKRSDLSRMEAEQMNTDLRNYREEVTYQTEGVRQFLRTDPSQLHTQYFGVMKNGKRVAPNAKELHDQIIEEILKKPSSHLFVP